MLKAQPIQVTVQLPGGLGNQIFALAAGIHVSESLGAALTLDSKNIDYSHAGPELDLRDLINTSDFGFITSRRLPSLVRRASDSALYRVPGLRLIYDRILGIVDERNLPMGEDHYSFLNYSSVKLSRKNIRLVGYFQDLMIVESARTKILTLIREDFSSASDFLICTLKSKKILGVHVRGGDFLNSNWQSLVGNLSYQYYDSAISVALARTDFEEIWVFTNDLEYAQKMFQQGSLSVKFICQDDIVRPAENFNLLRLCSGLVISNSSFSFLAAFLSDQAKVVVAPEFFSKAKNTINGIPNSWIIQESDWI